MSEIFKFNKATPKQIFSADPSGNQYQENKYKIWREAWCVAKLCEYLNIEGLITAPCDEPVDVLLEFKSQKFKIQCVECKNEGPRGYPTDHPFEVLQNGMRMLAPMGAKNSYIDVHEKIFSEIDKKDKKYAKEIYKDLLLLAYLNIYFPSEEDIDLERLKHRCQNMNFEKIFLLNDGEIFMIKGIGIES